jgi:DNA-binding LytR/AlgR family response regulator
VVREIGVDAMPATIFVTAFDAAIRAFDVAAVDYLVKPSTTSASSRRSPGRGGSPAGGMVACASSS